MKIAGIILVAAMAAGPAACAPKAKITESGTVTTVNAQVFDKDIETPGAQILDVRSAEEYDRSHIDGATNINADSGNFIFEVKNQLKKDKPVYVYCRGGRRSREAADRLVKEGYEVVNLDGGLNGWKSEGLPVVGDSLPD